MTNPTLLGGAAGDEVRPAAVDFPEERRGYARSSVQAYVAAANSEMARLSAENQSLQATIARMQANVEATAAEAEDKAEHSSLTALDLWSLKSTEMLDGARRDIDRLMADAANEANDLTRRAEADAAKLIETAERESARDLASAQQERQRLLEDAANERRMAEKATERAVMELDRAERQRHSIAASLTTLQVSLKQAVDQLGHRQHRLFSQPTPKADADGVGSLADIVADSEAS